MTDEKNSFRVGKKLGTTVYRNNENKPCLMVFNGESEEEDERLAARVVELLNTPPQVHVLAMDARSFMENGKLIAEALVEQIRSNGPLTHEICQLVDSRTR